MKTSATPTLRGALARAFVAALAAATLVDVLLVALNGLAPQGEPLSIGLVFWLALVALYLAPLLALALLAHTLGHLLRATWLPRLVLGGIGVGFAALIAAANRQGWPLLMDLPDPARFRWLLPMAAGCAALALITAALWPPARWRLPTFLGLASTFAVLAALVPERAPASPALAPLHARLSAERILVVGVDGADWRYIDALIARGELPHLAALKAKGAWGRLETLEPTLSPIIWTTIATGMPPKRHGIRGFTAAVVAATGEPLSRLAGRKTLPFARRMTTFKPVERAGTRWLVSLMERAGLIQEEPVTSGQRRVPAFWTIATRAALPVNVVTWWVTWPAEPVLGVMISHMVFSYSSLRPTPAAPSGLTWPHSLFAEIAPLVQWQGSVTLDQARTFVDLPADRLDWFRELGRFERTGVDRELAGYIVPFETTRRVALEVLRRGAHRYGAAPDTLVLFRIVDKMSHLALTFSELEQRRSGATPEQLRRWGRIVTGAYRATDAALGELMDAFGDGTVIVISDHGFNALAGRDGEFHASHRTAPDGVFLAAGPLVRPGPIKDMSVFDILPLLLYLKGLPVAADLPGRIHPDLLVEGALERRPVQHVPTFGEESGAFRGPGLQERRAIQEHLEELRGLGYIQ